MTQALVKKSSVEIKGSTNTVRAHLTAIERAREIYLAQMKRAEADYFERIERATDIIRGATETPAAEATEPPQQPQAENPQ